MTLSSERANPEPRALQHYEDSLFGVKLNIHDFRMTYDYRMTYGSRPGYDNGIFASDPGCALAFASSTGSKKGSAKVRSSFPTKEGKAGSREIESNPETGTASGDFAA